MAIQTAPRPTPAHTRRSTPPRVRERTRAYGNPQVLIDSGALFHLNQNSLHPLGFALVVEGGEIRMIDARDQPDLHFDPETLAAGERKIRAYVGPGGEGQMTMQRRKEILGYHIQHPPRGE